MQLGRKGGYFPLGMGQITFGPAGMADKALNTGPDSLKNHKATKGAFNETWAIIGPPAKHHLNDGPLLVVFGSSLSSSTPPPPPKKK